MTSQTAPDHEALVRKGLFYSRGFIWAASQLLPSATVLAAMRALIDWEAENLPASPEVGADQPAAATETPFDPGPEPTILSTDLGAELKPPASLVMLHFLATKPNEFVPRYKITNHAINALKMSKTGSEKAVQLMREAGFTEEQVGKYRITDAGRSEYTVQRERWEIKRSEWLEKQAGKSRTAPEITGAVHMRA